MSGSRILCCLHVTAAPVTHSLMINVQATFSYRQRSLGAESSGILWHNSRKQIQYVYIDEWQVVPSVGEGYTKRVFGINSMQFKEYCLLRWELQVAPKNKFQCSLGERLGTGNVMIWEWQGTWIRVGRRDNGQWRNDEGRDGVTKVKSGRTFDIQVGI